MQQSTSSKPLSRQRILDLAEVIMRREGVEKLSLRKLARQLHVTPMALYRYFESKEALLAALLDRFALRSAVLPDQPLPWDEWLPSVAVAMWQALVDEPDWIGLIGTVGLQSGAVHVYEACVVVMEEAGFEREQAVNAFFSMIHCVLGAACLTVSSRKALARGLAAFVEDGAAVAYPSPRAPQFGREGLDNSLRTMVAGMRRQLIE